VASKAIQRNDKKGAGMFSKIPIARHDLMITGYVMIDYLARLLKLRSLRDHVVRFRCECGYKFNARLHEWWRFISHFEPKTSSFFRKNVSKEDIVFDIGAHIGIHTIHLAKIAKFVYAIEPEPNNLKLLIKNIFTNNVEKKVSVLPYAISSTDNLVNFHVSSKSTGAHRILSKNEDSIDRETILKVQAYTLDTLLFNILRIDHVDVIKIDVEGHELEVIKGAQKLLQHSPPRILVIETKKYSELLGLLTDKYDYQLIDILDCWNGACNCVFLKK